MICQGYNFYHKDHIWLHWWSTIKIRWATIKISSVKTSTWWQAGKLLRSNREGGMIISPNLKISNFQPLVPWLRVVLKHLVRRASSIISSDFVKESYIMCQCSKDEHDHVNFLITMVNVSMATSLLIGHLRSVGTSTITPSHPEPAFHNRSSSTGQCSWKGGKGSPGLCSREEGQHRRKPVRSIRSSGNHKRLQSAEV